MILESMKGAKPGSSGTGHLPESDANRRRGSHSDDQN